MTIAQLMEKMLAFSEGNIHDIDHLIRVWTYAKTIGELEGLDPETGSRSRRFWRARSRPWLERG